MSALGFHVLIDLAALCAILGVITGFYMYYAKVQTQACIYHTIVLNTIFIFGLIMYFHFEGFYMRLNNLLMYSAAFFLYVGAASIVRYILYRRGGKK